MPQPANDPVDPLNWSKAKKATILLVVSFAGFLADFNAALGPSCIIAQGVEWNLSPDHVNYANNLCILMQ